MLRLVGYPGHRFRDAQFGVTAQSLPPIWQKIVPVPTVNSLATQACFPQLCLFVAFGLGLFDVEGPAHKVEVAGREVNHLVARYLAEAPDAPIEVEGYIPVEEPPHSDDPFDHHTTVALPIEVVHRIIPQQPRVELVLALLILVCCKYLHFYL